MRIVLTGGGTGGHVMPFAPIIESLRSHYLERRQSLPSYLEPKKLDISFIGVADEKTKAFFATYDIAARPIVAGKVRRYASIRTIIDLGILMPVGIIQALVLVWNTMPDLIMSKGGYGSIPVVLAGAIYRIPILLHESDITPGASNTFLMRFATAVTLGFADTKQDVPAHTHKLFVTGTPVYPRLALIPKAQARRAFNIDEGEKVLLITGGSQGAQQLNEAVLKYLPKLIIDTTVIHITGEKNYEAVNALAQELLAQSARSNKYHAYPYLTDKMPYALSAADAVVSRAGASSLAEIARLRVPALIIPLASAAQDHQRKNARAFEKAGAAIVLEPNNLGQHLVEQNIQRVLFDEEARAQLSKNLEAMDYPTSAQDIAELAFRLAAGFAPQKET